MCMHGTDAATGVQQARAKRQEARRGEMQEMDGAEEEQPVQGWFTLARWRGAL